MKDIDWLLREKYHGEKTESFFTDVARLQTGEPLAYIIGHQPFLNTTIWLDSHPLIPRSETEFWVEQLIEESRRDYFTPNIILDLCAGSGCIGIALALAFPLAHITFVEIDRQHHKTILKNCRVNNINDNRYKIIDGDLFSELTNQTFDLVVSNPPYIDIKLERTEASVRDFEPALALYSEKNGLEILEKIIAETPRYLTANGQLWLEHEPEHSLVLAELAKKQFLIHTQEDQYGVKRFSKLVLQ